jgi:metal-sulfur cluster biosynthetic enzyme
MTKSWIFVEVIESDGEKTFKPLAGTEDKKCANRVLAAMKSFKDDVIKAEKTDLTLIHTSVIDDVEYNATVDECLNLDAEDNVAKILSLVGG